MTDEYTPDETARPEDPSYADAGGSPEAPNGTGSTGEAEQRAEERSVPGSESSREGYSDDEGTAAGDPLQGVGGQGIGGQGIGEEEPTDRDDAGQGREDAF